MFETHKLNEKGLAEARQIGGDFSNLLTRIERVWGQHGQHALGGREMAIVRTKLEEACFFAKKAIAVLPENQVDYEAPR